MKNKWTLYLLLILALSGLAYWLSIKDDSTGTSSEDRKQDYDFAVQDTASIDKIVLSDKSPSTVTLERNENGVWMVNGKYEARRSSIKYLLETLYDVQMKSFIPKSAHQTVIKRMAVSRIEVEVYTNGELNKTLFVGLDTQDQLGTYMMLKNASEPFITHIEGFNGYLTSRFFTKEHLWRDRAIARIASNNLARVEILYADSLQASFNLTFDEDNTPTMVNPETNAPINFSTPKVNKYKAAFKNVSYEGLITPEDAIWAKKDSIINSLPVMEIKIESKDGEKHQILAFRKEATEETKAMFENEELAYDPSRMYALVDNKEFVLIQFFGLQHVLKPARWFAPE